MTPGQNAIGCNTHFLPLELFPSVQDVFRHEHEHHPISVKVIVNSVTASRKIMVTIWECDIFSLILGRMKQSPFWHIWTNLGLLMPQNGRGILFYADLFVASMVLIPSSFEFCLVLHAATEIQDKIHIDGSSHNNFHNLDDHLLNYTDLLTIIPSKMGERESLMILSPLFTTTFSLR